MFKYLYTLVCVLFMVAFGNNAATNEDADLRFDGETIIVNENLPVLKQITVQKAHLQDFEAEFRTVGTVRPVAGKLAEIAPPFAGRIGQSFVRLGQKVSVNAPIFEIESS